MERLIECVPNFSEGCRLEVVDALVAAIASASADGSPLRVLHVDRGEGANRTVITFVGTPEAVCEGAFRAVQAAAELIDMRLHHGIHPRIGATDVLPLVPVSGVTLAQCAQWARLLAERIFRELGIPCYCYEAAAFVPERRNLAVCRSGEYESLPQKITDPLLRPDYSPAVYNEVVARSGAINVGARNFLIAVNFNLDTTSMPVAHTIACDVREKGRKAIAPDGMPLTDADGHAVWQRGPLKGCKAIGWYIEEYGIAQVSMNITDIEQTSLYEAYDTVCRYAAKRGTRVTGTEIIGLVPKRVLVEAGRHYAAPECLATADEATLIATAIQALHLDDLCPFDPQKKIIELAMAAVDA